MKLNVLFSLLFILLWQQGCKKKSTENKKQKTHNQTNKTISSPINNSTSVKIIKRPVKPIKKDENISDLLDKMNFCILNNVKTFKNISISKENKYPIISTLKIKMNKCRIQLLKIINMGYNITEPYKKYFTLAASTIDKFYFLSDKYYGSKSKITKKILSKIEKSIEVTYNKFALQNNDLNGIQLVKTSKNYKKSDLDIRTYSDEFSRVVQKSFKIIYMWNTHYSKDVIMSNKFNSNFITKELVIFSFLHNNYMVNKTKFKYFHCIKGYSNKKISVGNLNKSSEPPNCKSLLVQSNDFFKLSDNYFDSWKTFLYKKDFSPDIKKNFIKLNKNNMKLLKNQVVKTPSRIK